MAIPLPSDSLDPSELRLWQSTPSRSTDTRRMRTDLFIGPKETQETQGTQEQEEFQVISPPTPKTTQSTQDIQNESKPPVKYTVYTILLIAKGGIGKQEDKMHLSVEEYELNDTSSYAFTAFHLCEQKDLVQEKALDWSVQNAQKLTPSEIIAIPKHGKWKKSDERSIPISTYEKWQYVVHELQRFDKQKKDSLSVDLIYKYTRLIGSSASQQSKSALSQNLTTSGQFNGKDLTKVSVTAPSTGSATQQQLQQLEAEYIKNPIDREKEEIGRKWTCKRTSCSNTGGMCWHDENDPTGKHYKLDEQHISLWHAYIASDSSHRLSTDKPPAVLIDRLKRIDKNTRKNELRATAKADINPPQTDRIEGIHIHNHMGNDSRAAERTEALERTVQELKALIRPQCQRPTPINAPITPHSRDNIPSSPIANDTTGDIDGFIDWIKQKRPDFTTQFEQARTTLLDQGISLDIIQRTKTPSEWKDYEIPAGIGMQLATEVKRWERYKYNINNRSKYQARTPSPSQLSDLPVRLSPAKNRQTVASNLVQDSQNFVETQGDEDCSNINTYKLSLESDLSNDDLDA